MGEEKAMDEHMKSIIQEEENEYGINIMEHVQAVFRNLWIIIIVAMIGGCLAYLGTKKFIDPLYRCGFTAYVNNRNISGEDISSVLTSSDLSASRSLAETYTEILTSRSLLTEALEKADLPYVYEQVIGAVKTSMKNDTEIIECTITMKDPQDAIDFADAIIEIAPEYIGRIVERSSMVIVDPAVKPKTYCSPNFKKNILIGVFVGGILAAVVVLIISFFDNTIKKEDGLSERINTALLGTIPDLVATEKHNKKNKKVAKKNRVLLSDKSSFAVQEAYKALRTNIIFSIPDNGPKCIGITSATEANGKSTNSINIATAFAQIGKRVIVVDSDMRRPTIAAKLDMPGEHGLSNVLINSDQLWDIIQSNEEYNIDILASGIIPPDATRLLESDRMEWIINELKDVYDYIFIDLPPVLATTDAAILSKCVDGFLVVVKHENSDYKTVISAIKKLRFIGASILGCIYVNAPANSKHLNGYYGGYYKK